MAGGSDDDVGMKIKSDAAGNVYCMVIGGTADFDLGPGVFNLTSSVAA